MSMKITSVENTIKPSQRMPLREPDWAWKRWLCAMSWTHSLSIYQSIGSKFSRSKAITYS